MRIAIAKPKLVLSLLLVVAFISIYWTESRAETVTGDTVVRIKLDIFIDLFGVGISFPDFVLILIGVIVLIVLLIIAAQEYNIYRRKKFPNLFRPNE